MHSIVFIVGRFVVMIDHYFMTVGITVKGFWGSRFVRMTLNKSAATAAWHFWLNCCNTQQTFPVYFYAIIDTRRSVFISVEVKIDSYRRSNGHQFAVKKGAMGNRSCQFRNLSLLKEEDELAYTKLRETTIMCLITGMFCTRLWGNEYCRVGQKNCTD
jgi:hypothetical protein